MQPVDPQTYAAEDLARAERERREEQRRINRAWNAKAEEENARSAQVKQRREMERLQALKVQRERSVALAEQQAELQRLRARYVGAGAGGTSFGGDGSGSFTQHNQHSSMGSSGVSTSGVNSGSPVGTIGSGGPGNRGRTRSAGAGTGGGPGLLMGSGQHLGPRDDGFLDVQPAFGPAPPRRAPRSSGSQDQGQNPNPGLNLHPIHGGQVAGANMSLMTMPAFEHALPVSKRNASGSTRTDRYYPPMDSRHNQQVHSIAQQQQQQQQHSSQTALTGSSSGLTVPIAHHSTQHLGLLPAGTAPFAPLSLFGDRAMGRMPHGAVGGGGGSRSSSTGDGGMRGGVEADALDLLHSTGFDLQALSERLGKGLGASGAMMHEGEVGPYDQGNADELLDVDVSALALDFLDAGRDSFDAK